MRRAVDFTTNMAQIHEYQDRDRKTVSVKARSEVRAAQTYELVVGYDEDCVSEKEEVSRLRRTSSHKVRVGWIQGRAQNYDGWITHDGAKGCRWANSAP